VQSGRNFDSFLQGSGEAPQQTVYTCAQCGFSSTNRKHFRSHEEGKTCATGHYEDKDGELKRARNPYARR
jgi:hypothetical protein